MKLAAENQVPWLMHWFIHKHKYRALYAQGVCLSSMQSPSRCCYLGTSGCHCWNRLEDDRYLGENQAGSGELEALPESEGGGSRVV